MEIDANDRQISDMIDYAPNDNVQDVHDINKMNNILPSPQARTYSYKTEGYNFEKRTLEFPDTYESGKVDDESSSSRQREPRDPIKNKHVSKMTQINCDHDIDNYAKNDEISYSSVERGLKLKSRSGKSPIDELLDRERSVAASSPSDVWRQTKSKKHRKSKSPTPHPLSIGTTDNEIYINAEKIKENEEKIKNLRYIVSISNSKKKQIHVKNGVNSSSLKDTDGTEASDDRDRDRDDENPLHPQIRPPSKNKKMVHCTNRRSSSPALKSPQNGQQLKRVSGKDRGGGGRDEGFLESFDFEHQKASASYASGSSASASVSASGYVNPKGEEMRDLQLQKRMSSVQNAQLQKEVEALQKQLAQLEELEDEMDATSRDTKQAAASVSHMVLPFKHKEKESPRSGYIEPVRMGKHGSGASSSSSGSKPGFKPGSGSKTSGDPGVGVKEGYEEHKNREKNLENIDSNVRNLKQKQSLLKLNIGNSELNVIKIRENEGGR